MSYLEISDLGPLLVSLTCFIIAVSYGVLLFVICGTGVYLAVEAFWKWVKDWRGILC